MASRQEVKRYRANLADELHSAALYDTLAKVEKDDTRKQVYSDLASSEREHAQVWAEKLKANGIHAKSTGRALKTRLMRTLVHVFGAGFVLPTLAAAEYADRNKISWATGRRQYVCRRTSPCGGGADSGRRRRFGHVSGCGNRLGRVMAQGRIVG